MQLTAGKRKGGQEKSVNLMSGGKEDFWMTSTEWLCMEGDFSND